MTQEVCYSIVNGPSELDFFVLALARGMVIEFIVKNDDQKERVSVILNGVYAEDGSRKSWIFQGFVEENNLIPHGNNITGFFNYQNRTGWIKLLK